MEIWQLSAELAVEFHLVAAKISDQRFYRYGEQLRAAGLSTVNNIAEGSGSIHPGELRQFLNIARRSVYENASMLIVFRMMKIVSAEDSGPLLARLETLSRKIKLFMNGID